MSMNCCSTAQHKKSVHTLLNSSAQESVHTPAGHYSEISEFGILFFPSLAFISISWSFFGESICVGTNVVFLSTAKPAITRQRSETSRDSCKVRMLTHVLVVCCVFAQSSKASAAASGAASTMMIAKKVSPADDSDSSVFRTSGSLRAGEGRGWCFCSSSKLATRVRLRVTHRAGERPRSETKEAR